VGEIVGDWVHGQTFTASGANLCGLRVLAATFGRPAAGRVEWRVFDGPDGRSPLLAEAVLEGAALADNDWVEFRFAPRPDSEGRFYHFAVSSPRTPPGTAATLWAHDGIRRPGAHRTLNGLPVPGSLCFQALYP
jgi:hypothetical protein